LLFGRPEMPSFCGGSPKTGSMTLAVSEDLPVEFSGPAILHLVAHEYHHTWMQARCQPADELRFVMEGFTDWFAYLVLHRLELQPEGELQRVLLEKLGLGERALAEFGRSLADAGGAPFFGGGAPYDACYAAGLGLAGWIDMALDRAGASIDLAEFLRRFYNDPRWLTGQQPTCTDFRALLEAQLGAQRSDWLTAFERAVTVPGGLDFVALFGVIGLPLERRTEPLASSSRANFEGTSVTAIDPAGPAARLGLRSGDRLLAVMGQPVSNAGEVQAHWRPDAAGQFRLRFERGGKVEELVAAYPLADFIGLADDQGRVFPLRAPARQAR
jgi:predicted metalloprotease with PDZ domain